MRGSGATVFTVGHSNREATAFVALLQAHGVRALVDVRRHAASRRHPQFAKDEMGRALSACRHRLPPRARARGPARAAGPFAQHGLDRGILGPDQAKRHLLHPAARLGAEGQITYPAPETAQRSLFD